MHILHHPLFLTQIHSISVSLFVRCIVAMQVPRDAGWLSVGEPALSCLVNTIGFVLLLYYQPPGVTCLG